MLKTNTHLETRIANRLRSMFAAFGQVISDFYLEAGIYFVGLFNAALVAWDIYTDLLTKGQPLAYAITLALVALIAVEGLAVYLVGAAAKTNNGWLWFFSVVFASFFTFAHYQEMAHSAGVISQYITLAIPFFVVVGYWARTLKIEAETSQVNEAQRTESAQARKQRIEDEERARKQRIEDEERRHKMEIERLKIEAQNEAKLIKAEGQNKVQTVQKEAHLAQMNRSNEPIERANQGRQSKKMSRQNDLVELVKIEPDIGPTELARRLNEMGHSVSVSTVKRDIKALNGVLK